MSEIKVTGGSSGIELHGCSGADLRKIVAVNVRGPYPRGQAVQFSMSPFSSLRDFYLLNTAQESWVEDVVSVWRSAHCTVRDGLIDGNNSPSGVGVMFEN